MLIYGGVVEVDTVRTSDVYSIWLKIPSLKESCWEIVSSLIPDIEHKPKPELFQLGIPSDLIDRLS
jgi:hypothetical protein